MEVVDKTNVPLILAPYSAKIRMFRLWIILYIPLNY